MEKIIKYGFQPVINNRVHGQNNYNGKKLYNSGHLYDVDQRNNLNEPVVIIGKVMPQTNVSKVYNVKITVCIKNCT